MSAKIRRQSIVSAIVIYLGFAIGFLNTYFFTRQDIFAIEEYGLITLVTSSVVPVMASLAGFAMPSFVYKFYPYYNDNLKPSQNDMLTWALLVNLVSFSIIALVGYTIHQVIVQKFTDKSPLFVKYYYWTFIMGFGLTMYNVLEAYAVSLRKVVLTSFLKEAQWRLFTTVIIILFLLKIIPDFDAFVKLYFFSFLSIAITLFAYLMISGRIHITFSISKVTGRFLKKIVRFCFFLYSAQIIGTLSIAFDVIVIAAAIPDGASKAAIFGLAQIMTSVIQAPQRGIIAASIAHLAQAWKDKDIKSIRKIYQRSSINMLIFALGLFVLIAVNYTDAIRTFHLNPDYLLGFQAFIFLGLTKVVDMGSGVNAQIIGTSNYWRFELITGVILLMLIMPLTYFLAIKMDILGPAVAQLISVTIYNIIRIVFLYRKFRMQPFTRQSAYAVLLALLAIGFCYLLFNQETGWFALVVRSLSALLIFGGGVYFFNLSPDIKPVVDSLLSRSPWHKNK